jgi:hypothetical protein
MLKGNQLGVLYRVVRMSSPLLRAVIQGDCIIWQHGTHNQDRTTQENWFEMPPELFPRWPTVLARVVLQPELKDGRASTSNKKSRLRRHLCPWLQQHTFHCVLASRVETSIYLG